MADDSSFAPNGHSASGDAARPAGADLAGRGQRRIDRVLADDFLAGLPDLPLERLREMRSDAEQEEADLSYLRRLIQGRIDILRAELARRSGGGAGSLIDDLPRILADAPREPARGLGRHAAVEPSRVAEHRRTVERLVADTELSSVGDRTDEQIEEALQTFIEQERGVSSDRRAVQEVMDACTAEVGRRYREGGVDATRLLHTDD